MKALQKYMAHRQAKGEADDTPIRKEESKDIGAEDGGEDSLEEELKEPASRKGKLAPEHAKLLGMEDEDEYG